MEQTRSCNGCTHAFFEDFGYSNYTVEGTTFSCVLGKHPDGSFDRFYGEDERLAFAIKCDRFVAGEPIELDCDGETYGEMSDDEKARVDAARACIEKAGCP